MEMIGWIASAATMMMTAANLGARVTGWGFVIFALGSVCWAYVGSTSNQTDLLATNIFLTFVNMLGIWRWLGRQRAYKDGGKSAQRASQRSTEPTLITASGFSGLDCTDRDGRPIGKTVEALIECATGTVSYVVIASGGVAGIEEGLRAIARSKVRFQCNRISLTLSHDEFERLPILQPGRRPANADEPNAANQSTVVR